MTKIYTKAERDGQCSAVPAAEKIKIKIMCHDCEAAASIPAFPSDSPAAGEIIAAMPLKDKRF